MTSFIIFGCRMICLSGFIYAQQLTASWYFNTHFVEFTRDVYQLIQLLLSSHRFGLLDNSQKFLGYRRKLYSKKAWSFLFNECLLSAIFLVSTDFVIIESFFCRLLGRQVHKEVFLWYCAFFKDLTLLKNEISSFCLKQCVLYCTLK